MQNDLISRKSLIERLAYYHAHSYGKAEYAYGVAVEEVVKAPTIDAAPVVHARWERSQYDRTDRICSACHGIVCGWHEFADCTYEFCPWCGAKMDGGAKIG